MPDTLTIYIDDQAIPACQRAVLAADLTAQAAIPVDLQFLTDLTVRPAWATVPLAQARALTQLLQLLADPAATPFVWLNGSAMVTGPLEFTLPQAAALYGTPELRLGLQELLLVNPQSPAIEAVRKQAAALLAGDFTAVIDAMLPITSLPATLTIGSWHDPRRGAIASCQSFAARPWLNAAAPVARAWERRLTTLLQAGHITPAMLEADVTAGRLRPSLLAQVSGIAGTALASLPPAELQQIDAVFPQAELQNTQTRLQIMQTARYAVPRLLSQPTRPRELPRSRWLELETAPPQAPDPMAERLTLFRDLLAGSWRHKLQAVYLATRFGCRIALRQLRAIKRHLLRQPPAKKSGTKRKPKVRVSRTVLTAYKRSRGIAKQLYHYGKYAALNPGRSARRLLRVKRRG